MHIFEDILFFPVSHIAKLLVAKNKIILPGVANGILLAFANSYRKRTNICEF